MQQCLLPYPFGRRSEVCQGKASCSFLSSHPLRVLPVGLHEVKGQSQEFYFRLRAVGTSRVLSSGSSCVHPWSPQWQWIMTAPGVHGSGWHLLPKLMQVVFCCLGASSGKRLQWRVLPLPAHASSKQWHLVSEVNQTSSAYTFGCGHTRLQPFQSLSCWQPQFSPWV